MAVAFLLCSPFGSKGVAVCRHTVEPRKSPGFRLQGQSSPWKFTAMPVRASVIPIDTDDDDDGGDGFFGGNVDDMRASLGITVPDLSLDERVYLASATDDYDRMERLKSLARKRKNMNDPRSMNRNLSTAEDYMATLSRMSSERHPLNLKKKAGTLDDKPKSSPKSTSVDKAELHELRKQGMNAGELYVESLRQSKVPGRTPFSSQDDLKKKESSPDDTQASAGMGREKIRNASRDGSAMRGNTWPSKQKEDDPIVTQIKLLEEHLAKLKAADELSPPKEPGPDPSVIRYQVDMLGRQVDPANVIARSGPSPGKAQGWGDGPAEMTEEERLAAFDEVRRRNAGRATAVPADPFATPLPTKRANGLPDPSLDDGPAELSDKEIQAKFEELRLAARRPRPAPHGPSDDGNESKFRRALIALRVEQERYIQEAKLALEDHEQNIRDIFYEHNLELD